MFPKYLLGVCSGLGMWVDLKVNGILCAVMGRETCKQEIVLQHKRCHNRGTNIMWWETGTEREVLIAWTKGRHLEGRTKFRAEGTACADRKTYKEKCGVLKCQNILHSDCQRGARELRAGAPVQLPAPACPPALASKCPASTLGKALCQVLAQSVG